MGKLMEQFKLQVKANSRRYKKEQQLKQVPIFDNFNLDYSLENNFELLLLIVTNILNIHEPPIKSEIHSVQRVRDKPMITQIICPICGKPTEINKHWNCYICNSEYHIKKIYEIKQIIVPEYVKV
jgi:hypothetical protein